MRSMLLIALVWGWSARMSAAEVEGRLIWTQIADIGVAHAGVVAEVSVSLGQKVDQGALLLALDAKPFQTRKAATEAQKTAAFLRQEEALREKERAKELFDRGQTSEHERQMAENAAAQARAVYASAVADEVAAAQALAESRLLAPFPGRIIAMAAYPGQQLSNRCQVRTLLRLARDRYLGLRISAAKAKDLTPGQAVKLKAKGQALDVQVSSLLWLTPDQLELGFVLPEGMGLTAGSLVTLEWP